MVKLTEGLVLARSRASDLENVRKLNCWGSELSDVKILRKLPNVQVVSLSVNKIATLEDFSYCKQLEELYIRKNNICCLSQICHLCHLPKLRVLWLADNPCDNAENYRMTVLRMLPNLQRLDNIGTNETSGEGQLREFCSKGICSLGVHEMGQWREEGVQAMSMVKTLRYSLIYLPTAVQKEEVNSALEEGDLLICPEADDTRSSSDKSDEVEEASTAVSDEDDENKMNGDDVGSVDNRPAAMAGKSRVSQSVSGSLLHKSKEENPAMMSWDETNQIRKQLGLRALPVEKVTPMKPRTSHSAKVRNANVLQAVLHLIKELDPDSLEVVQDAVRNKLEGL